MTELMTGTSNFSLGKIVQLQITKQLGINQLSFYTRSVRSMVLIIVRKSFFRGYHQLGLPAPGSFQAGFNPLRPAFPFSPSCT
jgi:hypothetical protein